MLRPILKNKRQADPNDNEENQQRRKVIYTKQTTIEAKFKIDF